MNSNAFTIFFLLARLLLPPASALRMNSVGTHTSNTLEERMALIEYVQNLTPDTLGQHAPNFWV